MRILIIGASGTIGRAIASALGRHELVLASKQKSHEQVDISDTGSVRALFKRVGRVDAVVNAAGGAAWKPLAELTDADFAFSFANKLMGQINLVRLGTELINDNGSITLTAGSLARHPQVNSAAVSTVNAGLEGFVRAAALESPRGHRVNVVSPPWVSETLQGMGMDSANGFPAADVARSYVESVEGTQTGQVLVPRR